VSGKSFFGRFAAVVREFGLPVGLGYLLSQALARLSPRHEDSSSVSDRPSAVVNGRHAPRGANARLPRMKIAFGGIVRRSSGAAA
jgi:hypothetical protein